MGAPVDQRYGSKAATTTTTTTTTTATESNNSKNLLAERFKTKICQNFEKTGVCPYEVRCMFAHGLEDLRTTEMNFRDRLTSDDAIKSYQRSRLIAARQAKKRAKDAARQLAETGEEAKAQVEQHLKPPRLTAGDGVHSPNSEPIAIEYLQVTQPPSPAGLHEHPGDLASAHDLLASQHNNALSMSSVLQPCAGEASLTSFVDHNFLTAPQPLPPARAGSKSPTTANLASSTFSVDSAMSQRSSRRFRHDPYNQQPLGMSARRSLTPSNVPQLSVEDIKVQAEHDAVSQSSTPQCERCLSARRGSLTSAGSFIKPVSPLAAAMMAKRSNNATPDSWFEEPLQPNFCFDQKSPGLFESAGHL